MTWGSCRRRPPLPPALYCEHVAPFLRFDAPLPNMLYVFGGRNRRSGPVDTAEMLDTWHGVWVPCPPMPRRRAGSAAAALPDGRLLVVGGYDERGIVDGLLSNCDLYDPFREQWVPGGAAPLLRARWGHGCAAMGGKVYAVGGCSLKVDARPQEAFMETLRSCEVYDPKANKWDACSSLEVPRSGSRVVTLGEHLIAAVGGCDDVFGRAETQATIEVYSTDTGRWSLLERRLTLPRTSAGVAVVGDHCLFVAGGAPSQSSVEFCHMVGSSDCCEEGPDAAEDKGRSVVADMPEARMGCQAAVLPLPCRVSPGPQDSRRCLVVVGGERCDQSTSGLHPLPRVKQLSSVAVYDLEARSWCEASAVPPMAVPRTTMALCLGVGRVGPARLR